MPSSVWPSVLVLVPLFRGGALPEPRLPLPPARQELVFAGDTSQVTLEFLLDELARVTGQELALSRASRSDLSQQKVALNRIDPVPAPEVYGFVESLLAAHEVVIAPLKGGSRPVLAVYSTNRGRAGAGLPEALVLPTALFDEAVEHPALLVRTLIVLRNTDTRQLQTQLRQLTVDPTGITNIVPAGERGLLLQGRASVIVALSRQVLEMDEAVGRGEPAKLPLAEEGAR